MNASQTQLDKLREYTPDVVAALTNVGQASAYYDANGHYVRVQPTFFAFGIDGLRQLTARPPADRYQGLETERPLPRWRRSARARRVLARRPSRTASPARPRPGHETTRADRTRSRRPPRSRRGRGCRLRAGPGESGTYKVRAIFDDASFAVPGEQVRIAGAPVGSIASLDVCVAHTATCATGTRKAAVTLEIDDARFTPFHAERHVRDPAPVADRRDVRRLQPGTAAAPAAEPHRDTGRARGRTTCRSRGPHSPVDFDIVQDI